MDNGPWYTNPDWWGAIGQWVGGIGTIVSVWIAVWIAMRQIKETRRLQLELMMPDLKFDGKLADDAESYVITATNIKSTPVPLRAVFILNNEGKKEERFEFQPFNLKTGEFMEVKVSSKYWSQEGPVLLSIGFSGNVDYSIFVDLLVIEKEYLSKSELKRIYINDAENYYSNHERGNFYIVEYVEVEELGEDNNVEVQKHWYILGESRALVPLLKKVKRRYTVAQFFKKVKERYTSAQFFKKLRTKFTKNQKEPQNKEEHSVD